MVQQKNHEEVVEMEQKSDGIFHPVALVRVDDKPHSLHGIPQNAFSPHLPRWIPVTFQLIDGFVIGLGAIENFMINVRKLKKRRKP